jgi:hypothetical protein
MDVSLSIKKGCVGPDANRIPSYLFPDKSLIKSFHNFPFLSGFRIYIMFGKEPPKNYLSVYHIFSKASTYDNRR